VREIIRNGIWRIHRARFGHQRPTEGGERGMEEEPLSMFRQICMYMGGDQVVGKPFSNLYAVLLGIFYFCLGILFVHMGW
jgi:hypothetical protein